MGTATSRDRFVDATRAIGTVAVVLLHWLMPVVTWDGNRLGVGNALTFDGGWLITWVVQIMPLMFFAAGCATYGSLRRATDGWSFLRRRLSRLLWPVGVFLVAWAVAGPLLVAAGVPWQAVRRAAGTAPQLLWFVAVYLLVLACAPVLGRLHDRYRWRVPALLAAGAIVVDIARFSTGITELGYLNALFVWLIPHQLGYFYADGTFARWPARRLALIAAGGVTALAVLVVAGPYPASMIGMPGDAMSNMNPPTVCLVALTTYQIAIALLLRPVLSRLPERPVAWLQRHSMTVYLWHLTAAFLVFGVLLLGFGARLPEPGTAGWWLTRPLWLAGLGLVLAIFVWAFRWAEQREVRLPRPRAGVLGYAGFACLLTGLLLVVTAGTLPPLDQGLHVVLRSDQALAVLLGALGVALGVLARRPQLRDARPSTVEL
ncbi:acyltransferase family protein [Longispora albida]|uniref:acyltransferase family protein n=1 Tax=Longispora albida TaxID=203523 RepID=UPI000371B89B|nr:acyltransferase [Longispora albida]